MSFERMPRSREEIETANVEATTLREKESLLLEAMLDLRDLVAECAWRLSDLVNERRV